MKKLVALYFLMLCSLFPNAYAQNLASEDSQVHRKLVDLEAFFDGSVGTIMSVYKIPGIAVSVVYHDELVFTKGYGYADVDRKRPVDPSLTLFRMASVSKTFTWTAVMQLAEQGQVDLDRDVNEYITQFVIPDTFQKPITLRHLMSHTAGFEDTMFARLFRRNAKDVLELADALEQFMPERVREPGLSASYSNYGTSLAGLIVANVSGQSYNDYVEDHILKPLGMMNSSFREPLPARLQNLASASFFRSNGDYIDKGWEYLGNFGPAASLTSTVVDIARFMRAHLNEGAVGSQRILAVDTAISMRNSLFRNHKALNGVLHGFLESHYNGRRAYGHSGDSVHFHSEMAMFPDEELGIFIATNAPDGGEATKKIIPAFMDRYFPVEANVQDASESTETRPIPADLQKYVGTFRVNRRSETRWEKAAGLGFGDSSISISAQGGLVVSGRQRFVPIGGNVFQSVDDADNKIAFAEGGDGLIEQLFISFPAIAFHRVGFLEAVSTHRIILSIGLIASIFVAFQGFFKLPHIFTAKNIQRVGDGSVWLACICNTTFFLALIALIIGDPVEVMFAGVPGLIWLLFLPLFGAVATAIALGDFAIQLRRRAQTKAATLRRATLLLVLCAFSMSMTYWNLLGPWNV